VVPPTSSTGSPTIEVNLVTKNVVEQPLFLEFNEARGRSTI